MCYLDIFKFIVDGSIVASILAVAIFGVRILIKGRLSPIFIYLLWIVMMFKLIIPYGPESNISLYNLMDFKGNEIISSEFLKEDKLGEIENIKDSRYLESTHNISGKETNEKDYVEKSILKATVLDKLLFSIWICGVIFFTIKIIISALKIKKLIYLGNKIRDEKIEDLLVNLKKRLKIKNNVQIVFTKEINSPAIYGIVNTKLFLNKDLIKNVSDNELRYILLHELCHLKRNDILVSKLINLMKVIYWFNPIIIIALNTMQSDCEVACDAKVLNFIDKKENLSYGKTIINILSYSNSKATSLGTIGMAFNKKMIKERISMIGKNKKFGLKSIVLGGVVVLGVSIIGLTSQKPTAELVSEEENINNKITNDLSEDNIKSRDSNLDKSRNDIVIYSAHTEEYYSYGEDVENVGSILSAELNKKGLNSMFLKNNKSLESSYNKSFERANELIIENIEGYNEKILLDIHRAAGDSNNDGIAIILSENNPLYEENKVFADTLKKEIKDIGIKNVGIYTYPKDMSKSFNQELSSKAIMIEIGSEASNKEQINTLIDGLASALEKNCK
ncbi:M56 family metallopeptidase [Clostridium sp.]|uniref:M56 family metallopeptidase n=1 Tax=Clostridium sp. TaxID=1506 RepID=UPI003F3BEF31